MAETGAVFGGEHRGTTTSGTTTGPTGIIAAMLVLELLSVTAKPLSELLEPFQALLRHRRNQH